jgi:hypothetical protein
MKRNCFWRTTVLAVVVWTIQDLPISFAHHVSSSFCSRRNQKIWIDWKKSLLPISIVGFAHWNIETETSERRMILCQKCNLVTLSKIWPTVITILKSQFNHFVENHFIKKILVYFCKSGSTYGVFFDRMISVINIFEKMMSPEFFDHLYDFQQLKLIWQSEWSPTFGSVKIFFSITLTYLRHINILFIVYGSSA